MTAALPWYLWGAGAAGVGFADPKLDRTRCSECRRWTRDPVWYGVRGPGPLEELDRALCHRCHDPRVDVARRWAASLPACERSDT